MIDRDDVPTVRRPVRRPVWGNPPGIGAETEAEEDDEIVDAEIVDESDPDQGQDQSEGIDRRLVLAGAAGATGLTGVGLLVRSWRSSGSDTPDPTDRKAAYTPAEAGGFTSREESFVAGKQTEKPSAKGRQVWDTPEEAARNTKVTVSTILATDDPVKHLLRRTTFGPTPSLADDVRGKGINGWIEAQMNPQALPDDEADLVWGMYPLASASPPQIRSSIEKYDWKAMTDYGKATFARQVWSQRQLFEVMVDFWANHLNVATPGGTGAWDVAPAYHNDVIRRHALGSFTDMLLAANRHPAMLRYLSNDQSNKDSVNENLGRELLELHTVGIGGGYTEDDVRNSAYILTGRTVGRENDDRGAPEGSFLYDPDMHWTGPVQVLDFRHDNPSPEGGLEVGDAYLRYLASHPATAQTIARKLAVRFVSDSPPKELVDRLATQFRESGTAIGPVLDLMFRSSEFWAAVGQKTRRPLENAVASFRALEVRPGNDVPGAFDGFYHWTRMMGHQPLGWVPPNGYPDVYQPWRSASGMLEMWNTHRRLTLGWQDGVAYTPVGDLLAGLPQGTVGEYVDSMCQRLCLQTFRPEDRDSLIGFVNTDAGTPVSDAGLDRDQKAEHLAALVLDSPYFALR